MFKFIVKFNRISYTKINIWILPNCINLNLISITPTKQGLYGSMKYVKFYEVVKNLHVIWKRFSNINSHVSFNQFHLLNRDYLAIIWSLCNTMYVRIFKNKNRKRLISDQRDAKFPLKRKSRVYKIKSTILGTQSKMQFCYWHGFRPTWV